MSGTHTFAVMEVTQTTYDEIKENLASAGYQHTFMEDGTINMTGIGLKPIELPVPGKRVVHVRKKTHDI